MLFLFILVHQLKNVILEIEIKIIGETRCKELMNYYYKNYLHIMLILCEV
jgi:hypothetical protein